MRRPPGRLGGFLAVFERDFLVTTSRMRFLWLRVAVVFVAAVVVAFVIGENLRRPPDLIGRYVLGSAAVVLPLLVLLIAPAAAAPCISAERDGGTLDLVRAAPGNAFSLVLAKFLSRFLGVSVLVFAALPVAAVSLVYGGVSIDDFLEVALISVLFAALGSVAGVLASARSRSTSGAVLGAYLLVIIAPALPWVVVGPLFSEFGASQSLVENCLTTQPIAVWVSVVAKFMGGGGVPDLLTAHAAVVTLAVVAGLALATRRMAAEGAVPASADRKRKRARRHHFFLDAPILDRGVRGTLLSHPRKTAWVMPLIAAIGVGFHIWFLIEERQSRDDMSYVFLLGLTTLFTMIQVLASASSSIAVERRNGSLDLLLATPYRHGTVVVHRTTGAVLSALPTLALPALHGAVACAIGFLHPLVFAAWLLVNFVLLGFTAALGVRVSANAKSPGAATLRSFALLVGGMVLHGLLLFLLAIAGSGGDVFEILGPITPPAIVFVAPSSVMNLVRRSSSMSLDSAVVASTWLAVAGYFIASWVLVGAAARALRMDGE